MNEFNIGDEVKIINDGHTFTTYYGWVEKFAPIFMEEYENRDYLIRNGLVGRVVALGEHELYGSYGIIYLVQTTNRAILIGSKGLELVKKGDGKMENWNGELLCIKDWSVDGIIRLNKGKIYKVVNGKYKYDDDGFTSGTYSSYNNLIERNPNLVDHLVPNNTVKTYSIEEVIKMLKENPNRRFGYQDEEDIEKGVYHNSYITVVDEIIVWLGEEQEGQPFRVHMDDVEWYEVECTPTSMTFQEVLEVVSQKGNYVLVKVIWGGETYDFNYFSDILDELRENYESTNLSRVFLEGQFFIKDN